jgi:hypothetical protein
MAFKSLWHAQRKPGKIEQAGVKANAEKKRKQFVVGSIGSLIMC